MVIHQARNNLIDFAIATDSNYQDTWFHETLANLLQWAMEEVEQGRDVRIAITIPPRHGKLLSDDTDVLTTKGWKKHGDLKEGDFVFNQHGRPVKINHIFPKHYTNCLVKFSDGSEIKCHENHEWVIYDRQRHRERIIETKELFGSKLLIEGELGKRGCRYRYQIDKNATVHFKKKKLRIKPYILGVWLGDGTYNKNCITHCLEDSDIVKKIEMLGYKRTGFSVHKDTGAATSYFKKLYKELVKEGFLYAGKAKKGNKVIPNKYLHSSKRQRLELLAGLIDTDGHKDKRDRYRFSTCSKQLALNVQELALSLGSNAYIMEYEPVTSSSGIIGKQKVYQVGFNLSYKLPVALKRKRNSIKYIHRKRAIVSVERLSKRVPGKCINVDGGIYLVGRSLIPTHNSNISTIKFPAWVLGHHPDWPIIVSSYSGDLAVKFGESTRDIMQSHQYQSIFNTRLRQDAKAKGYWKTVEGGSYTSAGAGGAITGTGLKIGIIDDIFKNREEAESKTIRDSRWDWYRSTFYTRQEGATAIIILNTRWHTDDLVGRLLEQQKKDEAEGATHYDKWRVINFPAIATDDEEYRKKGEALWPEKFSVDKLKTTENTLGPYEFAALYQGNPITSENQEFKQEWIKYRTWAEVEALNTRKFATIDPGGKELENDDTGIVRCYVDQQNNWYLKAIGVHIDSSELINYVFRLHDEGFEKIGIEETVFLKAIKPFFDQECRKRNKFPNIEPLKHNGRQKEVRIRGLIPRYSSGSIFHIEGECRDLENQMWIFPKGSKDDVIDAACYQNDIAEAPVSDHQRAILNHQRQQRREEVRGRYGL